MKWIKAYKLALKSFAYGVVWAILGILLIFMAIFFFLSGLAILSIPTFVVGVLLIPFGFMASVFKVAGSTFSEKE